jgi:hypothetical protein
MKVYVLYKIYKNKHESRYVTVVGILTKEPTPEEIDSIDVPGEIWYEYDTFELSDLNCLEHINSKDSSIWNLANYE